MVFIRQKRIKKSYYAYLVENIWTKKGSRQQVKAYLGRIVDLEPDEKKFTDTLSNIQDYVTQNSITQIVHELITFELRRSGFNETLTLGNLKFEIKTYSTTLLRKDGKPGNIILKSHDGYICKETISPLLAFNPMGEDDREDATILAKLFVEAGLQVPKELFIELYQKLRKNTPIVQNAEEKHKES